MPHYLTCIIIGANKIKPWRNVLMDHERCVVNGTKIRCKEGCKWNPESFICEPLGPKLPGK